MRHSILFLLFSLGLFIPQILGRGGKPSVEKATTVINTNITIHTIQPYEWYLGTCSVTLSQVNSNGKYVQVAQYTVTEYYETQISSLGELVWNATCDSGYYTGSYATDIPQATEAVVLIPIDISYCGDGVCLGSENVTNCYVDCNDLPCCSPELRTCGVDPRCGQLCGLCPYGAFCASNGNCSTNWTKIDIQPSTCSNTPPPPTRATNPCYSGPDIFLNSDFQAILTTGTELVVHPGYYCGGFSLHTAGIQLSASGKGVFIVPCDPLWWDPSPPDCGSTTTPPCLLENNLITIQADSIVINGITFNGSIPNPLYFGNSVGNLSPYGNNVVVGAARAIANWAAAPNRTKTVYPILTLLVKNNFFYYFEDTALDFIEATVSIQGNTISDIGTVPTSHSVGTRRTSLHRQSQTEENRGARKNGAKATGVSLNSTGGSVSGNDVSNCNYGGMNGGDYPPSSFPFKRQSDSSGSCNGSQCMYWVTTYQGNSVTNAKWGGLIFEDSQNQDLYVESNSISSNTNATTPTNRGFIVEALTKTYSIGTFSNNSVLYVNNPLWIWDVTGVSFADDDYQQSLTAVQIVNCNQYEPVSPTAGSSVDISKVNITDSSTAYLLVDEPADNPLCSLNNRPVMYLTGTDGWIFYADVGIESIGSQVEAPNVSIFTVDVNTKVERLPNQEGDIAAPSQLPPDCPPTCNGHGECAGINICACDSGYYGYDCSEEVCADGVCTASETLQNCVQDCQVAVLPASCTSHRGFNESTMDMILTVSALNKNLNKLNYLLSEIMSVKANLPVFIDNCCSPTANGLQYPLSNATISQISAASYAFSQQLQQFNQETAAFQTQITTP